MWYLQMCACVCMLLEFTYMHGKGLRPEKLSEAAVRGQRSVFFSKRRKNNMAAELTSPH